jgi:DNA invertase Pin-like site-specific DNA recombinase
VSSRALIVEGYVRRPAPSPWSTEAASVVFESATAQRGWRLVRILRDRRGSHRLDEALRRVESGEIDGLVVAQLPDLGRSLREAVAAIDRIRAAGGTLLSVSDAIELGPNTGESTWRLLVSLAEW